jgi:hypothetical protein
MINSSINRLRGEANDYYGLLPFKFFHIHITNAINEPNKLIFIIHAYNEYGTDKPSTFYKFNNTIITRKQRKLYPIDYEHLKLHNYLGILNLIEDKKEVSLTLYGINDNIKNSFESGEGELFPGMSSFINNKKNFMFGERGNTINNDIFGNEIANISYHIDNIPIITIRPLQDTDSRHFGW